MSWMNEVRGVEAAEKKEFNYESLKKGEYLVRINRCALTETFKGQECKPHIDFELELVSGEYRGRKIWSKMYLTKEAYPMTRRILEDGGFNLDQPEHLLTILEELADSYWAVYITPREYQGKTKYFFNLISQSSDLDASLS